MRSPFSRIIALGFLPGAALAGEQPPVLETVPVVESTSLAPWEKSWWDLESGAIFQFGNNTPLDYTLVPTQISWRSPGHLNWGFDNGMHLHIGMRASLIGTWVVEGPESHYFGISGGGIAELWSPGQTWALYFGSGGGAGAIDASGGNGGGQGRDLTFNWYLHAGVRRAIGENISLFGGAFFQHMSNRGATDPNPGIDAVGFTAGVSVSF